MCVIIITRAARVYILKEICSEEPVTRHQFSYIIGETEMQKEGLGEGGQARRTAQCVSWCGNCVYFYQIKMSIL